MQFHASRLVIGDKRFDSEFKVDLLATLNSKVTKQPKLAQPAAAPAAPAAPAAASSDGSGGGGADGTLAAAAAATDAAEAPAAVAGASGSAAAAAGGSGAAAARAQPQDGAYWQRTSAMACKVKLAMTLRLPHPLSIVPGPLLSTTASLVARLVMQSLLPSFLELLATDYGRWAAGSSRAAPVGSLVAAGREQQQQQTREQQR